MKELYFNSLSDILQFAINEEKEAYQFYTQQARKTVDLELKLIWEQLATDEIKHKAQLSNILELEENTQAFFSNLKMIDFEKVEIPQKSFSGEEKIILQAVENENEAYFMYKNLADRVNDEKSKNILLTMANEELKHKMSLLSGIGIAV